MPVSLPNIPSGVNLTVKTLRFVFPQLKLGRKIQKTELS
jgi:hypothetical protein